MHVGWGRIGELHLPVKTLALLLLPSLALGITTNPASNVTADSESTPLTIPLRDSNGQFDAAFSNATLADGSMGDPVLGFANDPALGIHRDAGMRAFVIAGTTGTHHVLISLNGVVVGSNAGYPGSPTHKNLILGVGVNGAANRPDLLGNYLDSQSNNLWSIVANPIIQVGSNMADSAILQGVASSQLVVSTGPGYKPVQVNNFHAMGCTSDEKTKGTWPCVGLEIDGPQSSTATSTIYGILNHSNAYFDTIYSTVSNIRLGQSAATNGGLGLRNSFPIAWRNAANTDDITALRMGSDNFIAIGTGTQTGIRLDGAFSWGRTAVSSGTVTGGIIAVDNITVSKAGGQIQSVGTGNSVGAYGAGTTYLDAMNAAGNDGLRIDNGGSITRYSSGAKGVVSLPSGGGIGLSGTGSPTTGGALCLNSSNILAKCTSAVDASGNCTCP